jgi:hypothetical protein
MMRKAAQERVQQYRRRWLTRLTVLLGSLLVAGGGLGLALGRIPVPLLWLIVTGLQVGAGLIYRLHYPYAPLLVAHGHAEPRSVNRAIVLLGLKIGVLTTLALAGLTWIMLLKG